jgi:hypothetical protein
LVVYLAPGPRVQELGVGWRVIEEEARVVQRGGVAGVGAGGGRRLLSAVTGLVFYLRITKIMDCHYTV